MKLGVDGPQALVRDLYRGRAEKGLAQARCSALFIKPSARLSSVGATQQRLGLGHPAQRARWRQASCPHQLCNTAAVVGPEQCSRSPALMLW